MTEPVDPGPPPAGLVVRPQGEGFYARVSPRPPVPWGRFGLGMVAVTAAGSGIAAAIATDACVGAQIVASIALFGLLLLAFAHGAGYFPVEIAVDDREVAWGGDRFPLSIVGDCVASGRQLSLVARDGRVLAQIDGIPEDVCRWLALAIRYDLPGR